MPSEVFARNARLRARLDALIELKADPARGAVDVVVTPNEVNRLHGTGPLLHRLYRGRANICAIRSRTDWGGRQDFGDWSACISHTGRRRVDSFQAVIRSLGGREVRTVLCAPYLTDDVITSIAIKDTFGAKLCAYIMDDQNVMTARIPDVWMREFLEKCSLRLVTHPELRSAYEQKYGLPFFLLPAVVPHELIPDQVVESGTFRERRGVLIGSIWDQAWFDRLCDALATSGYGIDWYGNNRSPWIEFQDAALAKAGITAWGVVPEERLAEELRKYPFALVPVGTLDGEDANDGVARLSLPGRILFAAGTSHTPVLVVGSEETCAARFVRHLGIGECVPYEARAVCEAMERLSDPAVQKEMRERAARAMPAFSDRGAGEWLKQSIELGQASDTRFEDAFAGYPSSSEKG